MLFRKHNVSSRTLFQLTLALVFFMVASVGAAIAATVTETGNPPLIVPSQMVTLVGVTQYNATNSQITGYSGDGGTAVETLKSGVLGTSTAVATGGAALASPAMIVVDAVGNVYIADANNDLIREVNAQTGVINTIAGEIPTGCNAATATCTTHYSGCQDGVPAYGTPIGSPPEGVAVDSFGNVYFSNFTGVVYVVYRGGQRVADFINRVNPGAVTKSGGVKVGYLYLVAGAINKSTCSISNSATNPNGFAFTDTSNASATLGAELESADYISVDAAGNLYIAEGNGNSNANEPTSTTLVVNTQETPQTFYQYTVQPGYMRQIVNCSSATSGPCQNIVGGGQGSLEGQGVNGPVNQLTFGGAQYLGGEVDGYGNMMQTNGSGSGTGAPGIYGGLAYAGGPGMTNYLTAIAPVEKAAGYDPGETIVPIPPADSLIPAALPLTYGNSYHGLVYDIIRPNYWNADMYGSMWFSDQHYPLVERIDQFQGDAIILANTSGRSTTNSGLGNVSNTNGTTSHYASVASFSNPWNCQYGNTSPANDIMTFGPQSYDPHGDNCFALVANYGGSRWTQTTDSIPNEYLTGNSTGRVLEINAGNQFPANQNPPVGVTTSGVFTPGVAVGSSITQYIQVHFDASNNPVTGGASAGTFTSVNVPTSTGNLAYTTNAFTVTSASGDFTLDTTTPEFPMNNYVINNYASGPANGIAAYAGLPSCSQLNLSNASGLLTIDTSYDCLAFVKFKPTQPGYRTGTLVATTANGSVYTFQLTGMAVGSQLAIDGGAQSVVAPTGLTSPATLGASSSIAVNQATGAVYIADPANNRIVVNPTSGNATTIGPNLTVVYPSPFSGTPVQKLVNPQGVALDAAGNVYISDTGNLRILQYNPVTGIATIIGNDVWVAGAACDGGTATPAYNVNCKFTNYTGNTLASAQTQSILNEAGAAVTATVAPPQYQWGSPLGLAVDGWGNVYVADAGNSSSTPVIPPAVVMIPANIDLGGATPLLQYTGAPTFTNPVAVAVDSKGFIYVADTQNIGGVVVRIPPGGGDLQPGGSTTPGSALSVVSTLPTFGGQGITNPNGVAVDAAGDVFVSDASGNAVWEAPAVNTSTPFTLSFSGLSSPAGLAIDANGNVYVADSGNKRVLFMNRQNPTIPFGTVPQSLGASGVAGTPSGCPVLGSSAVCTGVLTVTNVGNQPATLTTPFLGAVSNGQFTISSTCVSPLPAGATCAIKPLFTPTSDGAASASVTVNGTQSMALLGGTGANPEVNIVLIPSNGTGTSPNYAVATPGAETITATVTQPHVTPSVTPTGTVTFTYVVDATGPNAGICPTPATSTVTSAAIPLVGGVATWTIPGGLAAGLSYTVSAVFTPGVADTQDSITNSQTPILITVAPSTVEAVTATSVTYQYGNAVPAITGSVTPALPSGVTVAFTSGASQYSNVGTYPIVAAFTGTNFCSYGTPVAYSSGTTPATVTETKAALTVVVPAYTTVYGAATFNYASGIVITGAVGTDIKKLSETFTPADSSVLNVGMYPVVATLTGKPVGNYTLTITNGSDTVTPAPSAIGVTAAKTGAASSTLGIGTQGVVLNTAAGVASSTYTLTFGSQVTAGKGTPTGSALAFDYFVPITSTTFITTPLTGIFPSLNGVIQWPSSTIMPCAVGASASASCTPVVSVAISGGSATFIPPAYVSGTATPYYTSTGAVIPGTHYFSFLYSGDAGSNGDGLGNFSCTVNGQVTTPLPSTLGAAQSCPSTSAIPYALVVDNPDFSFTSTTSPLPVLPGNIPSGNGLPSVPNQNGSYPQSAIIEIAAINSFVGTINLTCAPQNPSYVSCFIGQITVVNGSPSLIPYATVTLSTQTVPAVFDVSTPATLPIGFNTASLIRTTATRTVLAFLPFGVLAFCVRRRRRLSKALWMLIAIAAVGAVMSGCGGGNNVDFYTPVPTGAQTVTVNASYTSITPSEPTATRSYVVPINID
jgi:sugar lactone lactonase YvrE